MEKILLPILDNNLAPRFDMTTDVLIVSIIRETSAMGRVEEKVKVLETPSAEAMCRLALSEAVQTVICAGIEKDSYDFLEWKGIQVLDNICGPVDAILEAYLGGRLNAGQSYFKS